MTTPLPQDALVARLGDDLAGVTRELDRIRESLLTLRTAPAADPTPSMPPRGLPAPWPPPGVWSPPPAGPAPRLPGPWQHPQRHPSPAPRPARTPRVAWSPARLLAVTGAAITVLGVVLLLVLAAGRGWFGPEARVAG
ncbi:MAG TPA: hypothetical protein VK935_03465, partial [Actinomycetospora sp.]|nr:hypothetical protein [Actinomycetospora sp.]